MTPPSIPDSIAPSPADRDDATAAPLAVAVVAVCRAAPTERPATLETKALRPTVSHTLLAICAPEPIALPIARGTRNRPARHQRQIAIVMPTSRKITPHARFGAATATGGTVLPP